MVMLKKHESLFIHAIIVYPVGVQFDKLLSNKQSYFRFFQCFYSCTYIGKSQLTFSCLRPYGSPLSYQHSFMFVKSKENPVCHGEESKTIQQMYVLTYEQKFLNKII